MATVRRRVHGTLPSGEQALVFTLARGGVEVEVSTFGATLVRIVAPDREGRGGDVLLGLPTLADYVATDAHFGAVVGRYANRIAGGRFTLDGITYALPRGPDGNTLHGGPDGFDKQLWDVVAADDTRLALRHVSPDGDNGFPGTLALEVTYALSGEGALTIDYAATTDRPTILNPTNHAYFNLAGEGSGDVLDHEVTVAADAFLPTDATQIPTGERREVAGTPFDLRRPTRLRALIRGSDPQLLAARGLDHSFVLRAERGRAPVATAYDPGSGRRLSVATTCPALQVYAGNSLDGSAVGRSGRTYRQSDGLCFEAQSFPNAPNEPSFPSTVLRPGERFAATTRYAFSAQ